MKLDKGLFYIYLLLLLISPFVQAGSDNDAAERFSINVLPPIVNQLSSAVRWIIFFISIAFFLYKIKKLRFINKDYLLVGMFYFIQVLYAIITISEIERYISLCLFSITIPFFVFHVLSTNKKAINYSCYVVYFLVILSILFNYSMVFSGMRFSGFSNNSNLFAVTAIFWLTILLLKKEKGKFHVLMIFLTLIEIFLSGSRNGMLGVFIVLFIHYRSNLKILVLGSIASLALIFLLSNLFDLHTITERLLNIGDAAKDSGRGEFWEPALKYINIEPYWGHGMHANERLAGTGNVHNVYLRYLLNMGLFFMIISFTFYLLYLVKVCFQYKIIPGAIIGFIITFTLNNYGEDFLVGIGSSIFVNFTYILGFTIYYSTNKFYDSHRRTIHK